MATHLPWQCQQRVSQFLPVPPLRCHGNRRLDLPGKRGLDEGLCDSETIENEDRSEYEQSGNERSLYDMSDSHSVSPFSSGSTDSESSSSMVSLSFLALSIGVELESCFSSNPPGLTS